MYLKHVLPFIHHGSCGVLSIPVCVVQKLSWFVLNGSQWFINSPERFINSSEWSTNSPRELSIFDRDSQTKRPIHLLSYSHQRHWKVCCCMVVVKYQRVWVCPTIKGHRDIDTTWAQGSHTWKKTQDIRPCPAVGITTQKLSLMGLLPKLRHVSLSWWVSSKRKQKQSGSAICWGTCSTWSACELGFLRTGLQQNDSWILPVGP